MIYLFRMIRFLLLFKHPFRALRDRLNLIKAPLVEHPLRNGLTFWCRPGSSDLMSVWDIFSRQKHSDYLRGHALPPAAVVVDIGANIGTFAILCAAQDVNVYAYEPIADTFNILKANMLANKTDLISYRVGVGENGGRRAIYLGNRNHSMSCSFYQSDDTSADFITIDTVPFLSVLNRHARIDFLKIDCEGAEFEFVKDLPSWAPPKPGSGAAPAGV